jgi:hypothetical protein
MQCRIVLGKSKDFSEEHVASETSLNFSLSIRQELERFVNCAVRNSNHTLSVSPSSIEWRVSSKSFSFQPRPERCQCSETRRSIRSFTPFRVWSHLQIKMAPLCCGFRRAPATREPLFLLDAAYLCMRNYKTFAYILLNVLKLHT